MRKSPEKLIARLRNRKGRIIGYGILSVMLLGLLVFDWYVSSDYYQSLIPEKGEDLNLHVVTQQVLLPGMVFLIVMAYFLAGAFGIMIAMFFIEITTYTKNDLLVNLWDRLQALEKPEESKPGNSETTSGLPP